MADTTTVGHRYNPDVVLPPGCTLVELLDERGMTQAELAERTGLSEEHIGLIVDGQAHLTAEVAALLQRETGVSAQVWANLEATFQTHRSRTAEEAPTDRGVIAGATDGR